MLPLLKGRPLWTLAVMVLTLAAALGACSDESEPVDTTPSVEALSPVDVVSRLLAAVDEGRFEDAAALTDTTQAALLTLVEGADVADVAEAIEGGGEGVAANFWSGFAQTLEEGAPPDAVEMSTEPETTEGNEVFVRINVRRSESGDQYFILRRDDRWRIDLMASFGSVLADRMLLPVDNVLESANPNAVLVIDRLRSVAPSLRVAIDQPGVTPETRQSLLALLERVTRAGT